MRIRFIISALMSGILFGALFAVMAISKATAGQPCQEWRIVYRDNTGEVKREKTTDPYYAISFARDASYIGYRILRVNSVFSNECEDMR